MCAVRLTRPERKRKALFEQASAGERRATGMSWAGKFARLFFFFVCRCACPVEHVEVNLVLYDEGRCDITREVCFE